MARPSHIAGMKTACWRILAFSAPLRWIFQGIVHGLGGHTEGMKITPQISPMITDKEKHLCPSVESVAIFEGGDDRIPLMVTEFSDTIPSIDREA
ncbi:MAG: hypothetical protein D6723_11325 [Acidobacteria bacterium]|nr:MAG: hypothetical protein D6723_11325 [Acidobacteriota bacterium]